MLIKDNQISQVNAFSAFLCMGNGNPLQYSCLENPVDGGAWEAAVHGVAKSCTRLHFHFLFSHVWEDERLWAHWNHFSDTHLDCLGSVSCLSPPWTPPCCTVESSCYGWGLEGHDIFCLLICHGAFFNLYLHHQSSGEDKRNKLRWGSAFVCQFTKGKTRKFMCPL